MNYTSTRGTVAVNETYALLHGLAEDGGLYVPSLFPTNCLTSQFVGISSFIFFSLTLECASMI